MAARITDFNMTLTARRPRPQADEFALGWVLATHRSISILINPYAPEPA